MASARKRGLAAKSQRVNFRASAQEARLIRLGAAKRGEPITRFIIASACGAAEMALADEKQFQLPPAQFARFTEALDRPARVIPALKRLFLEESVIERQAAPVRGRTSRA